MRTATIAAVSLTVWIWQAHAHAQGWNVVVGPAGELGGPETARGEHAVDS